MAIKHWQVQERPRERLLQQGAAALSDAELLALFLGVGVQGMTAVDLARRLLSEFGSLSALLKADTGKVLEIRGMGPAKWAQICAALELAQRQVAEQLEAGDAFTHPDLVRQYLANQLKGLEHEVFLVLFLDNQHRILRCQTLAVGGIDGATVYPREVVKMALAFNAAAVIFAHNHPSGLAEPSDADRQLTVHLRQALGLVEIRVLDHFIVASGWPYSFAEHGLL
ncbi:MAG: repair protein RadC [Pseudomonadota bacterium]|jgi:DNA repair protein RadC